MKTNLGYKIRRVSNKKDGSLLHIPMKCYSCAIKSGGMMCGDKYEVDKDNCDGFLRACVEDMSVVECDGYVEQKFSMSKEMKNKLREWLYDYLHQSVNGRHNITQQSDNWFDMEIKVFAGLLALLQNREGFNKLEIVGSRYLRDMIVGCCDIENAFLKIMETSEEVGDIVGEKK